MELKQAKEKAEKFAHELKKINEQLSEVAFRVGLTGFYNHRYFQGLRDKKLIIKKDSVAPALSFFCELMLVIVRTVVGIQQHDWFLRI